MTTARRDFAWVHGVSRCVRGAFLCGDGCDHRKQWVEDRLQLLSKCFMVEIAAYAVMSNHLHVVLRCDPAASRALDPVVAVRRWLTVFPQVSLSDGTPVLPEDGTIRAMIAGDPGLVDKARERLGNLSWFMNAHSWDLAILWRFFWFPTSPRRAALLDIDLYGVI